MKHLVAKAGAALLSQHSVSDCITGAIAVQEHRAATLDLSVSKCTAIPEGNFGFAMHSNERRSPSSPFPGGSAESTFV